MLMKSETVLARPRGASLSPLQVSGTSKGSQNSDTPKVPAHFKTSMADAEARKKQLDDMKKKLADLKKSREQGCVLVLLRGWRPAF